MSFTQDGVSHIMFPRLNMFVWLCSTAPFRMLFALFEYGLFVFSKNVHGAAGFGSI